MLNGVNLTFVDLRPPPRRHRWAVLGLFRPGGGGGRGGGGARDHRGHVPPAGRGDSRRHPLLERLTQPVNAAYVIVALPLARRPGAAVRRAPPGDPLSGWIATIMAGGSFVATVVVWAALLGPGVQQPHRRQKHLHVDPGRHLPRQLRVTARSPFHYLVPFRHRGRRPDHAVLDRLHEGRLELRPVLFLHEPVPLLDDRPGPGRQLPVQLPRLGRRRLLLLRPGRVLVRAGQRGGGGQEGVRHQPHRRLRVHDRPVPDVRALPLVQLLDRAGPALRPGAPPSPTSWRPRWACSCSWAPSASPPRSRCTCGCPTPWKARRRFPPSSTPPPWSPPAST